MRTHLAPSVSAMIRCHRDSGLVARLVRAIAPYVDEVVVVADEQMSETALGAIAAASPTRLVRIPHVAPNERANAFAQQQCSGDWVLRLCGDEIPSLELLRSLRTLTSDPRMTHYRVPLAWLWPDLGSALDTRPWWPDWQVRLLRNDEAVTHYPGITHGGLDAVGNHRYITAPIFHLDLVMSSVDERRAKARRYEEQRPGLVSGGASFNDVYYLPEERTHPPSSVSLNAEEVGFVSRLMEGPLDEVGPEVSLPVTPLVEVDRLWASKPWPADAYKIAIEILDREILIPADGTGTLMVSVENCGSATWPSAIASAPAVRLSYHWYRGDGTPHVWDGLRSPFPSPVAPGEFVLMPMRVASPGIGEWILEVDAVHDGVRWFDSPLRRTVTIR